MTIWVCHYGHTNFVSLDEDLKHLTFSWLQPTHVEENQGTSFALNQFAKEDHRCP